MFLSFGIGLAWTSGLYSALWLFNTYYLASYEADAASGTDVIARKEIEMK